MMGVKNECSEVSLVHLVCSNRMTYYLYKIWYWISTSKYHTIWFLFQITFGSKDFILTDLVLLREKKKKTSWNDFE